MKKPSEKKLTDTERKAKIDELGQLDAEIAPLEDKQKKAAALRAEIRGWYESKVPEQSYVADGFKFMAQIGPKGNERSIVDMRKVYEAIGCDRFLGLCSFTLKKLDEALSPDVVQILTTFARVGSRTVKTFARAK